LPAGQQHADWKPMIFSERRHRGRRAPPWRPTSTMPCTKFDPDISGGVQDDRHLGDDFVAVNAASMKM
jgi:hypothetical protein